MEPSSCQAQIIEHFLAWLDREVTWHDNIMGERTSTRRARIAELSNVNGGSLSVCGWGFISYGGPGAGAYGRGGLDQDEAFELMQYAGFIQGFCAAGDDSEAAWCEHFYTVVFWPAMREEWERARAERDAALEACDDA